MGQPDVCLWISVENNLLKTQDLKCKMKKLSDSRVLTHYHEDAHLSGGLRNVPENLSRHAIIFSRSLSPSHTCNNVR